MALAGMIEAFAGVKHLFKRPKKTLSPAAFAAVRGTIRNKLMGKKPGKGKNSLKYLYWLPSIDVFEIKRSLIFPERQSVVSLQTLQFILAVNDKYLRGKKCTRSQKHEMVNFPEIFPEISLRGSVSGDVFFRVLPLALGRNCVVVHNPRMGGC